jgi:hypothetical protein
MKQFYNLVAVCMTGIILISCSSEPKKVSARELLKNHQGLTYKLGEKKDTIFFTGISIDSSNIEEGKKYMLEEHYSDGILNGGQTKYYVNGKIFFTRNWKNGKLDGETKGLYASGITKYEGSFKNGEKDGKWNWYDENGKVTSTENWINGGRMVKCTCCNKEFNSKEGWSAKPSFLTSAWDDYYPKQDGGEYCSKKCALDCK